jgi:hypothetical protein
VTLELIVRPFQLRELTPPTIIPGSAQPQPPVVVMIGGEGTKTFKWSNSQDAELSTIVDKYKEINRTTKTVRVTNPDDDSQFVDFKRVEDLTLANTGDPTLKRKYTFKYPNDQSP